MDEFYIGLNSDIVFLLNVTGSMSNSLPSLKIILTNFMIKIDEEFKKKSHFSNLRYKVCGFRDQECDGDKWFIEFPFVRNIEEVSNHLNHQDMDPCGGCGGPDSLLDALYKIGMMPVNASKTLEDANKWGQDKTPCIIIISDSTFKNATLPEIAGFDSKAIYNKISDKCQDKVRQCSDEDFVSDSYLFSHISDYIPALYGLVPEWSGYDDLCAWPKSNFAYYINGSAVANLGKLGPDGEEALLIAQQTLQEMSLNKDIFNSSIGVFLKQIGKKKERIESCNPILNFDIVFLLNVTGSMRNSSPSLKLFITNFAKKIEEEVKGFHHFARRTDVRYKVCGFRDQEFDGDKWFIEFPFVRNIEDVSNQLNHRDMEPFGGTGKATSLLDAIYKIKMIPINATKTIGDLNKWPNKWHRNATPCIFIVSDSIFKNATLPEITGFDLLAIYNRISDKSRAMFGLVPEWRGDDDLGGWDYIPTPALFGLVPGWIGYDDLSAWPNSRFNYYIREEEITGLGKSGPEGDAAQIAVQKALVEISLNKNAFKHLINFLVKQIG